MAPMRHSVKHYTKLRVFVASPSDVSKERDVLGVVINELNMTGMIGDHVGLTIELLDWRTHVTASVGVRPEAVILNEIPVDTWDVFVTSSRKTLPI